MSVEKMVSQTKSPAARFFLTAGVGTLKDFVLVPVIQMLFVDVTDQCRLNSPLLESILRLLCSIT